MSCLTHDTKHTHTQTRKANFASSNPPFFNHCTVVHYYHDLVRWAVGNYSRHQSLHLTGVNKFWKLTDYCLQTIKHFRVSLLIIKGLFIFIYLCFLFICVYLIPIPDNRNDCIFLIGDRVSFFNSFSVGWFALWFIYWYFIVIFFTKKRLKNTFVHHVPDTCIFNIAQ